jgi:sugar lactone lactonase YvrE
MTTPDPLESFTVDLDGLAFVGEGLHRPECVLCTRRGDVYVADWRGGVTVIRPGGHQQLFGVQDDGGRGEPLRPNGIALRPDGSFLLADLSELGGVWHLTRDGRLRPFLREVDGVGLPPTNFVLVDHADRVWVTVSTTRRPRQLDYRLDARSGFVALVDRRGARIVADGLGYTNEVALDAGGEWLYVNETFGRRLTRFRVGPDGALSARETVATFGHGTYPDGLTLDARGGAWITSVVSNRVIRVAPDGAARVVLEESDPAYVEAVEQAFLAGTMGRPHLDANPGRRLRSVSSLAFGGPDLRTAHLGCLLGDRLATFHAPVAGVPPSHWELAG